MIHNKYYDLAYICENERSTESLSNVRVYFSIFLDYRHVGTLGKWPSVT